VGGVEGVFASGGGPAEALGSEVDVDEGLDVPGDPAAGAALLDGLAVACGRFQSDGVSHLLPLGIVAELEPEQDLFVGLVGEVVTEAMEDLPCLGHLSALAPTGAACVVHGLNDIHSST
jgi:hypothetical protein